MSRSDRGGPRLAKYSHAGESGPQPPSAFGISPRKAGGELLRAFLEPLPQLGAGGVGAGDHDHDSLAPETFALLLGGGDADRAGGAQP